MSDEFDVTVVDDDEMDDVKVLDEVFPDDEIKEQLVQYLCDEYEEIVNGSERAELREDWKEWRRISVAKPRERVRDYPWPNAANVTTPFTFSNVNGVVSHVKAAIIEKKPRLTVECTADTYKDHAAACQRWLNVLLDSPLHMNASKEDEGIIFDLVRMGTQVIEVPWDTRRVQFKRRTSDGRSEVVNNVLYDGPILKRWRLEDTVIRSHWDVQSSPYIGCVYQFTKQDLLREEFNGFFRDVEAVLAHVDDGEDSREVERSQQGVDPNVTHRLDDAGTPYEVVKFYVRWDADNDGMDEDLIVWIQPDSKVVLRHEFNELGARPVVRAPYINVPDMFYALGVCAMLSSLQEEIDTMHNIGINSLHVSSLQMYVTPRGSGIGPDEPFFPLKNIQVDTPQDFQIVKFPNVSSETIQRENVAQQYGRSVTGISEGQLGMPDTTAKSGTSPTLQQFLAQQGNKVLRSIIGTVAHAYSEAYLYVLLQLVANSNVVLAGNEPLVMVAKEEDRELIREVLQMDVEDVALRFHFMVKTTEADKTDDARRQFLMQRQQMYAMYIQQAMGMMQIVANPDPAMEPLKEFAMRIVVGLTKQMEETLQLFNVDQTEDYLPAMEGQALMLELMQLMQQPQIEQVRKQVEAAKGGTYEGRTSESEGTGVYRPGYTANEGTDGEPGGQSPVAMAGRPAGSSGGSVSGGPGGPGAQPPR